MVRLSKSLYRMERPTGKMKARVSSASHLIIIIILAPLLSTFPFTCEFCLFVGTSDRKTHSFQTTFPWLGLAWLGLAAYNPYLHFAETRFYILIKIAFFFLILRRKNLFCSLKIANEKSNRTKRWQICPKKMHTFTLHVEVWANCGFLFMWIPLP